MHFHKQLSSTSKKEGKIVGTIMEGNKIIEDENMSTGYSFYKFGNIFILENRTSFLFWSTMSLKE